jgi:hypothetical protein
MTFVEPTASDSVARLSPRPPISAPRPSRPRAEPSQPALGLLGLLLVIPVAVALAISAGGEGSTEVIGPLVTYSLPLVAMVAFWWEDWPGTRLRPSWSGWADTALIVAGAIVLAGVGQVVAGGLDVTGLFDPTPGPRHVPTFPTTLPLAGAAFVAMLQLTLVGEGWPLRRLPRLPAGLLAVAISWAIALIVVFTLLQMTPPLGSKAVARDGPVPGADLGTALVLISAWQVLFYVVWRGWPFSTIAARAPRLSCAHAVVIAGGVLTCVIAHDLLGLDDARVAAVASCLVVAALVIGMLLEDWLSGRLSTHAERAALLVLTLALAALLAVVLGATADALPLARVRPDEWVEHAALNALSTSIILHVAIGRRWPFLRPLSAAELVQTRIPLHDRAARSSVICVAPSCPSLSSDSSGLLDETDGEGAEPG